MSLVSEDETKCSDIRLIVNQNVGRRKNASPNSRLHVLVWYSVAKRHRFTEIGCFATSALTRRSMVRQISENSSWYG